MNGQMRSVYEWSQLESASGRKAVWLHRVDLNAYPIAVMISRMDENRTDTQLAAVGETMNGQMRSVYEWSQLLRGRVDAGLFGYNRGDPPAVMISRMDKNRTETRNELLWEKR